METTLFLVLIAILTIVLVCVVALPDPRRGALVGEAEALVRFSATAAIAALATALMYLADEATRSVVALALGDGMMVLAAWMTWAALSAVNGRAVIAPIAAVTAAATSTTVSFLIPETAGTEVKLVIVAVGCLVFGVESLLGRVRSTPVYGVYTGVGFGFGGYTLVRVGVIAILGTDSTIYERAFTTVVSTVISGLSVTAITIGVVLLFREIVGGAARSTTPAMVVSLAQQVLAQGRALDVYVLDVAHIDLIRRAHGTAAAQAVRDALVEAAQSRLPSGVFALSPDGGRLTVVEAERRGAPSAAVDLAHAFGAAIERAGLVHLTEVDVDRATVRTTEELAAVLAHGQVPDLASADA